MLAHAAPPAVAGARNAGDHAADQPHERGEPGQQRDKAGARSPRVPKNSAWLGQTDVHIGFLPTEVRS